MKNENVHDKHKLERQARYEDADSSMFSIVCNNAAAKTVIRPSARTSDMIFTPFWRIIQVALVASSATRKLIALGWV
jgi:hypothetical protein